MYAEYAADPTEANLNALLTEVELYARRITLGRGGKLNQFLHQSATFQYPQTEISQAATIKVSRKLPHFGAKSKFSSWVYRITQNALLDKIREIKNRPEVDFISNDHIDYRKHHPDNYGGRRAASGKSTDSDFEVQEGRSTPLGSYNLAPDERKVWLEQVFKTLPATDRAIIHMFKQNLKPREIGAQFRKDAKWASNQLCRIKNDLKKLAKPLAKQLAKRSKRLAKQLAKSRGSNVLVMKGNKPLPASQAAD
jgi:RNA polymerase sigma factor (sigma-70 family)